MIINEASTINQGQFTVSVETLPPLRVACCRVVSPTPEEDSSNRLERWLHHCGVFQGRHFGFDIEVSFDQSQVGLRGYEVWQVVPPDIQPVGEITIREFAGGLYAVTTLLDPFNDPFITIPAGWKQLHEWVIQSVRYRGANHQWLEEIIIREDTVRDLNLYHPIVSLERSI